MPHTSSETPVGTPDELRLLGKPLSEWGSCAPPASGQGKGCAQYVRCIFARPELGGFRDQGPHNIGVLKVNNETGAAREDLSECFTYMHFMHDHNRAENAALRYEVIAQEGETIKVDVTVPVDPNSNKTGNVKMKVETHDVVIPPFPRPGMPGSKIEPQNVRAQATLQRHAARAEQARQHAALVRSLGTPPAAPVLDEVVFAAASPSEMPALPTPPMIPRRRGRPPKAR